MKTPIILSMVMFTPFISDNTVAEVTLDGTLGRAGALPGPDYQIGADVGQQHGGNLFHSFQDFNLQNHESATFSGPDNVQNVISRVTGGTPSHLDGTLRSTIPNADLYFLNPYGIMFGPNAKLDLQGGFHVSTADYLRLQDGGRFEARTPENSLLTVAPVAAFGFLTNTPAAIQTQDSQLSIPKGKTFSWIGGGLELKGSTPPFYDEDDNAIFSSRFFADSGRLNLASVASLGEVIPTAVGLNQTSPGGSILVTHAKLDVSSQEGGGNLFIRGGRFEMTNSFIDGRSVTQAGGVTDIQVDNLILKDGASIDSGTTGIGTGGSIRLTVTGELTLRGINQDGIGGYIASDAMDTMPMAGDAGNLLIQARQVNLSDGAQIGSNTFGPGQGGTVHLQVSDSFTAIGHDVVGYRSGLFAVAADKTLENAGNAGNIIIQARQVNLADGAQIASATFGKGQGGTIHLQVADTLTATGEDTKGYHSGVFVSSQNPELEAAGAAGNLKIEARQIILQNGGKIGTDTFGTGQGGTVHLQVSGTLTVEGRDTKGYSSIISAGSLNGEDAVVEGGSLKEGLRAGDAGSLFIQANTLNLTEGGQISTQTNDAGGGNITIHSPNFLYLQDGQITTSVKGGEGDGGNININVPKFVVLDKGQIKAQADAGQGGNIRISAEQFLKTPDSLISASSKVGLDGHVQIDSPDQTIGDTLLAGANTLNVVPSLLPRPCEWATFEEYLNRSTFYVYPIGGSSLSPYDLKPSLAFRFIPKLSTVGQASVSKVQTRDGKQRLAWLSGCSRIDRN